MTNLSFRDVTGLHALFAAATASRLCDISLRGCHMDEDQCLGSIVRFLRPGGNAIQKLDLSQKLSFPKLNTDLHKIYLQEY